MVSVDVKHRVYLLTKQKTEHQANLDIYGIHSVSNPNIIKVSAPQPASQPTEIKRNTENCRLTLFSLCQSKIKTTPAVTAMNPACVMQRESEPSEHLSVVVKENAHFLVELRPFFAGQGAVVAGGLSVTKVDEEAGILQKHCLKQGACKIQHIITRLALMRK